MENRQFLPISREDMTERSWDGYDVLLVTGDAYVDQPSFGAAIIGRLIEAMGLRVCVLSQPKWSTAEDFLACGRPKLAVMVTGGNIDSMVAHYTAAKRKRSEDAYSPGGKAGRRPDRAASVYASLAREAFPDVPLILGGLEASLRRFAHYDYWDDAIHPSILAETGADMLIYGMAESALREVCGRLASGEPVSAIKDVRGTCFLADERDEIAFPFVECTPFAKLHDKMEFAKAARVEHREQDPIRGRAVVQAHGSRLLVQNPPSRPLTTPEMDAVYALPFTRRAHPAYNSAGGVPAIEEVRFSIIHNRGCFGSCNFCALSFHQGRIISTRSHSSVLREAERIADEPDFKGYIHDVGGPTANMRHPACAKQLKQGSCADRSCLVPEPCKALNTDHQDYASLLRALTQVRNVKKVFVRSGLRYDYILHSGDKRFFRELCRRHISGQLKVAPEHCANDTLYFMNKPKFEMYEEFARMYAEENEKAGLKQYLVPYMMSSHPGCTLGDAIELALTLKRLNINPEQVQDFYPTPGTLSTAMYYAEIDPRTLKPVYVAKTQREKAMQRALLQWKRPEKRAIVIEALRAAGREDLIGPGKECLIYVPAPKEKKSGEGENGARPRVDGRKNAKPQTREKRGDRGTTRGGKGKR